MTRKEELLDLWRATNRVDVDRENAMPIGRRKFMEAASAATLIGALTSPATASNPESVPNWKTRVSLYTQAERRNARDNVQQYDWARERKEEAVTNADMILDAYDNEDLWNHVPSQEIPRAGHLSRDNSVTTPWAVDWAGDTLDGLNYAPDPPFNWKITNSVEIEGEEREVTIPTNDFAAYRESGRDAEGKFDPDLADDQYLVNEKHPEFGEGWGVDDGTGFNDDEGILGRSGARWVPVAWIYHWYGVYGQEEIVTTMRDAFLYTGDQRYARAASIILDRIADVYPSLKLREYPFEKYWNAHGLTGQGKFIGSIWEAYTIVDVIRAYDAVFPGQEGDDRLVSFLDSQASKYSDLSRKDSIGYIRRNIEEGLVQEILSGFKFAQIRGAAGRHQNVLAVSAVVQDDPDGYTAEALEYLFKPGGLIGPGESDSNLWEITGGDIMGILVGSDVSTGFLDRDGYPTMTAPHYTTISQGYLKRTADTLRGYDAYEGADLYQNPKFKQAVNSHWQLAMLNDYIPQIGDTYKCGNSNAVGFRGTDFVLGGYKEYRTPELAQWVHLLNGNSVEGLRGTIFDPDPEAIKQEIQDVIDAEGPLDVSSIQQAGYGFTALRDGDGDDRRAVYTFYGRNSPETGSGHTHHDTLNLGVYAHELDLTPELGYPERTADWPKSNHWTSNTISHNTVMVDAMGQEPQWVSLPQHFDHTDRVRFMDVASPKVYPQTDEYRRRTAMINVDDEDSYVVDFFSVDGGDDHLFSFHGAPVPIDTFEYDLEPHVTEFPVRDGSGQVGLTRGQVYDGEVAVEFNDPNGDAHDWRGLYLEHDGPNFEVKTHIKSGVTGYSPYWHHNQSVYLGRDADGRHVVAGVGNQGPDDVPRMGVYYPGSNEWGDHQSIANWEKDSWYKLAVSKSETTVEIALTDPDGSTVHSRGSFTLDSGTDRKVGVFGAIGNGQTGSLYFDRVTLDGTEVDFFDWNIVERPSGIITEGLDLAEQGAGTYAGTDVPKPGHGENTEYNEEVGNGFNYLYNVKRDDDPGSQFSIEWDVEDYWDVRDDDAEEVHLRLTMLNEVDEVALADGNPPQAWDNPEKLKYLLARRSGSDLQTTFTSVIEPCEGEQFVESVSKVAVTTEDADAEGRGVEVALASGRVDYVAYGSDPDAMYEVGDAFKFKGAFAVYSERDGDPEHAYLQDGKLLISKAHNGPPLVRQSHGRFEGRLRDFTRDLSLENELVVEIQSRPRDIDVEDLVGEWIYVEPWEADSEARDTLRNAAYRIEDVTFVEDDRVTLGIGEQTTIRKFESKDPDDGYIYNVKPGADFVIPVSQRYDGSN